MKVGDAVVTLWRGNPTQGRVSEVIRKGYYRVTLATGEVCCRSETDLSRGTASARRTITRNPYEGHEPYKAVPVVENPRLTSMDGATIVAWFRCNSCYTCLWRKNVLDRDHEHDIHWCARMHEKENIVDMVTYLGYSKE